MMLPVRASARRGFTLIELLVVMAIIAIAATLVGPLALQQFESSKRTAEREALLRLLNDATFAAYSHNRSSTLTTAGSELYLQKGQPSHLQEGQPSHLQKGQPFLFEYLRFPEQRLYLNRHGFWQPDVLRWYEGENERSVQLNMQLIETGEEGSDAQAN